MESDQSRDNEYLRSWLNTRVSTLMICSDSDLSQLICNTVRNYLMVTRRWRWDSPWCQMTGVVQVHRSAPHCHLHWLWNIVTTINIAIISENVGDVAAPFQKLFRSLAAIKCFFSDNSDTGSLGDSVNYINVYSPDNNRSEEIWICLKIIVGKRRTECVDREHDDQGE